MNKVSLRQMFVDVRRRIEAEVETQPDLGMVRARMWLRSTVTGGVIAPGMTGRIVWRGPRSMLVVFPGYTSVFELVLGIDDHLVEVMDNG